MDADNKKRSFLARQESPGGWLLQADSLHAAAQRLDWVKHPVLDDEPTISFIPEYQMLLGLSFENVLKGFITLIRLETGQTPPLPRECHVHKLEMLATRSECSELSITADEIMCLTRLSPYIEWAGRYPIPKKSEEIIAIGTGTHEREAALNLWARISALLYERAWIMKGGPESMGGFKLHLKRHG